ncbi:MAG: hypothetical protein ACI88G_000467 [Woeseiaceae bacterium]|jgi:hypothetical protein
MKRIQRLIFSVILMTVSQFVVAEELIVEFKGTGNRTTATFEARGPWILDWRINSDYNKMVSFDLDLLNGSTGLLEGNILNLKVLEYGRNGVRMFNKSGKFRLRINGSLVDWQFKVKQLTRAEAELYTPRNPR